MENDKYDATPDTSVQQSELHSKEEKRDRSQNPEWPGDREWREHFIKWMNVNA